MNEDLNITSPNRQDEIEKLSEEIIRKNTYSTDETIIGTWIDGKPIYRKVTTFSLSNYKSDKTANVLYDIPEINDLIRMDGFFVNTNNAKQPLNHYDATYSNYIYTRLTGDKHISFSTTRTDLTSVYLILEYTKNID